MLGYHVEAEIPLSAITRTCPHGYFIFLINISERKTARLDICCENLRRIERGNQVNARIQV